eukprot:6211924-Pleurochrysis_carterae.AAC.1
MEHSNVWTLSHFRVHGMHTPELLLAAVHERRDVQRSVRLRPPRYPLECCLGQHDSDHRAAGTFVGNETLHVTPQMVEGHAALERMKVLLCLAGREIAPSAEIRGPKDSGWRSQSSPAGSSHMVPHE